MSGCSGAECPDVVELSVRCSGAECPGVVELECPGVDFEPVGACISISASLQVRGRFSDYLCCFQ